MKFFSSLGGGIQKQIMCKRGIVKTNIPNLSSLSLLQMMKAVIFCAVAFACISPMLRLWQIGVVQGGTARGLVSVAIFEAVVVPLAWAGLAFVLIRRGTWSDGQITALLLCSVSVALGFACWALIAYTIPALWNPYERAGISSLALHATVILALAAATLFLSLRLWRGCGTGPSSNLAEPGERTSVEIDKPEL